MTDIDEILRYGLDRVSNQAHQVDLHRLVFQTSSTLRQRRTVTRTVAALVGVALTLSAATLLWNNVGRDGSTTPVDGPTGPTPTSSPGPDAHWLSVQEVAELTGIDQWTDVSDQRPRASGTGLRGCGIGVGSEMEHQIVATLVDSARVVEAWPGTGSGEVVYRVYRFYTPQAALDAFGPLNHEMQGCSPENGKAAGGRSSDSGSTDVRWREAAEFSGRSNGTSSLIVLRDTYLALLSWSTADRQLRFDSRPDRAAIFVDELVAETDRHEASNPRPDWALSWTGELGPDGLGGVRLGIPQAEAMATGELFRIPGGEDCVLAEFRADYASVQISRRHGVVAIEGGPRVFTPQGLRRGTTFAEFKRMYPNFREEGPDLFSAPVPGNPDARYVVNVSRLEGEPLKIYSLMMMSWPRDTCLDSRFEAY